MNSWTPDIQELKDRLDVVEKRNRRLRWMVMACLLVFSGFLFMGYNSMQEQLQGLHSLHITQLETERIVIRDGNGIMRGWLGIADDGARLLFYDQSGSQRAGFGLNTMFEPAMAFYDGKQNPRVILGLVEGWPGLVMRDLTGQKRISLQSQQTWSSLFFYDYREKRRSGIGIVGDAAAINLLDENGQERINLTSEHSASSMTFFDRFGIKRLGLGVVKEDEPAMGLFRADRSPVVTVSALNSLPEVALYGTNMTRLISNIGTNGIFIKAYGPEREVIWQVPEAVTTNKAAATNAVASTVKR